MAGVTQEQLKIVVHRPLVVLPHVVGRKLVAGDRLTERRLVVRLQRALDYLPALGIENGLRVPVLGPPMREDSFDRTVELLLDMDLFRSLP